MGIGMRIWILWGRWRAFDDGELLSFVLVIRCWRLDVTRKDERWIRCEGFESCDTTIYVLEQTDIG